MGTKGSLNSDFWIAEEDAATAMQDLLNNNDLDVQVVFTPSAHSRRGSNVRMKERVTVITRWRNRREALDDCVPPARWIA